MVYNGSNCFGHGHDRYVAVEKTLEYASHEVAVWDALENSAQEPVEGDVTSNTQWSIIFNNIKLTAEVSIRRQWKDKHLFVLKAMNEYFDDFS